MSLGIVIKGPEGLVLASESRLTFSSTHPSGSEIQVNFDNATKLLSFEKPHNYIGAVTYGQAAIGLRTANSFLPEFESTLPLERLSVKDFANKMKDFYLDQWNKAGLDGYTGPNMTFLVSGYNENEAYGRVYLFEIPYRPEVAEHSKDSFGISWGGQREIVDRLLSGYDQKILSIIQNHLAITDDKMNEIRQVLSELQMQIPLQALPLQDCVDLAIFFIQTTISAQQLSLTVRGCGGAIDVATITRKEGLLFIQKKKITGSYNKQQYNDV